MPLKRKPYRPLSNLNFATDIKTEVKFNCFTLWVQKFNHNTRPKQPTPTLKLGSMLQKAVLEPN